VKGAIVGHGAYCIACELQNLCVGDNEVPLMNMHTEMT